MHWHWHCGHTRCPGWVSWQASLLMAGRHTQSGALPLLLEVCPRTTFPPSHNLPSTTTITTSKPHAPPPNDPTPAAGAVPRHCRAGHLPRRGPAGFHLTHAQPPHPGRRALRRWAGVGGVVWGRGGGLHWCGGVGVCKQGWHVAAATAHAWGPGWNDVVAGATSRGEGRAWDRLCEVAAPYSAAVGSAVGHLHRPDSHPPTLPTFPAHCLPCSSCSCPWRAEGAAGLQEPAGYHCHPGHG